MIAKNIKGQSFKGCVNYVMKEDAEVLKAEGVMTMSKADICASFEFQRSVRPEIKSPVGHIPIAFALEDKPRLTNDFMVKLAEEYMQNMGITDTQYIIVKHNDTTHSHCHIVYNRINNVGQLITDKNDYRRNVATHKRLKDKYGLTYGNDKSRVNRQKLRGAERTKHQIFDAVKSEISRSKSLDELRQNLSKYGVSIELKYRRNSDIIEGISFCKGQHKFKGSQIDRKYSYKGLHKILAQNQKPQHIIKGAPITDKQYDDLMSGKKIWVKGMTNNNGCKFSTFVQLTPDKKMIGFSNRRIPITIGGIKLTDQQRLALDDGKAIWLEGIQNNSGQIYNSYVRYSDEKQELEYCRRDPDAPQLHEQEQNHNHNTAVNTGLGLLDLPADSGDDPEEDAFRRRMQKPKKKRRGIRI